MRILLVEDDESLASGLLLALRRAGYTVEHVQDGAAAVRALTDNHFDLVILDLGLPRLDGTEVLAALRRGGSAIPVLVLSARDAVRDRIGALDLGADDYLVKPFDLDELLARLRVLERRRVGLPVNRLRLGELELDLAALSVRWQGKPVELQLREFMLLKRLAEHPHKVFHRNELEESIYGWGDGVASNAIDVYVHHLRKKISPRIVETVRGMGYRIGQADVADAETAEPAAPADTAP
ncbi:two-component system OmpR family response regulator/two-component system response regulator QseB [Pseudoduganella flava]|uniref:Response regulator n=1 Tax=Pseudoduganella flava TaxID=871742 RepID=A0A562Q0Z6_9BURK|nr:response regulator transcription factor [Pseudoduganella flava]QGZ38155.1 response regulator [Pseudoduganella flava]TWI50324.1 two-component system OmpR family response regulator/two-component system response regulator QseB [Pseudoduganella flava]